MRLQSTRSAHVLLILTALCLAGNHVIARSVHGEIPPVGLNVHIINKAAEDVPLRDTFIGTLPFVAAELVRVLLLVMFPGIVLFLPKLLS